jgi:hypothetical protein
MQRDTPKSTTNSLTESVGTGYDSSVEDSAPPPNAAPEELRKIRSEWATVVDRVPSGPLKVMLKHVLPMYNAVDQDGKLYLTIHDNLDAKTSYDYITRTPEQLRRFVGELEQVVERLYDRHVDIEITPPGKKDKDLYSISVDSILDDRSLIGMPAETDEGDFPDE